jgi:hypothetical protein
MSAGARRIARKQQESNGEHNAKYLKQENYAATDNGFMQERQNRR